MVLYTHHRPSAGGLSIAATLAAMMAVCLIGAGSTIKPPAQRCTHVQRQMRLMVYGSSPVQVIDMACEGWPPA